MRYAETGVNLEIDLSRGGIEKVESDRGLTESHLGGTGTSFRMLRDRVPPEVKPFDPDNLLIFGTGLLAGTPIPAANRTFVTTVSPPTFLSSTAGLGGFWGPELKRAGYDKVVLRGKSPGWVYVWIHDDKVEIRDASHLLGKGPAEVTTLIREELQEPQAQVAAIGLAGENRVWMATIEHHRASASKGAGVIMGDKRVKAIAVRGTRDINIARPAELFEFCNDVLKQWRQNPSLQRRDYVRSDNHDESFPLSHLSWGNAREMKRGYWTPDKEGAAFELTRKVSPRGVSCFNCPNACASEIDYPGLPSYYLKCWSRQSYWMCSELDLDFSLKILALNHNYGLDTYSAPFAIAMAVELYQAGILTDQDMGPGFPSHQAERFVWLLERMVRREGIGDVIANGCYHAARQIGRGAEAYDRGTIKKLEQRPTKRHWFNPVYYLMFTTGEKASIPQIEGSFPQAPLPTREEREAYARDWAQVPDDKFRQYYVEWDPRSHHKTMTDQAACDIVDWNETMHYLDDACGLCSFWAGTAGQFGSSRGWQDDPGEHGGRGAPAYLYHIHTLPKMVSLATGMEVDEAGLWTIAHRNRNLLRAINVRLGLRRKDEEAPMDWWTIRDPEAEARLKDEYYRFQGWNNEGIPAREGLEKLGLGDVAGDLERRGILRAPG